MSTFPKDFAVEFDRLLPLPRNIAISCFRMLLSALESALECSGGILDVSWRYSGGIVDVFRRDSGDILEIFWRYSGGILEILECSGVLWNALEAFR